MSDWKARRFWKSAAVVAVSGGYGVELDGRPIKTPAKAPLIVPTDKMALAIAAEWDAQEGVIDPMSMPCTRTANSAIDKVMVQHREVADMLAEYGDSDLLCYRADQPETLVVRQITAWDPLLAWADSALNVQLEPRTGVVHKPQDATALARLSTLVHGFDPFQLAAFHDLVSLSGSLVIGLAATRNQASTEALWAISRVDEEWQFEQWGRDDEADALIAVKREAFHHAKRMFDMSCPQ